MPGARVAVVHYHLRPGGVTRVISRTVRALADSFQFALLSGEAPSGRDAFGCPMAIVEGLGYLEDGARPVPDLASRLMRSAKAMLGADPDIWHFHNHSLGKNPAVGEAVVGLASRGQRVLLHIHDFAEDGRSENYRVMLEHAGGDAGRLSALLYPIAGHVHYGTINSRDQGALVGAGVPAERVHLMHNPVEIEATKGVEAAAPARDRRHFLYPSRAIRRKNIGELLLWAVLDPGDRFSITMAPLNPAHRIIYDEWMDFACENNLPVDFEVGGGDRPLADLLGGADAAITTSLAEGFGLAFVEPILAGRPVVGRDLPEITAGLTALGIDVSGLYSRLDVPTDWIGENRLRDAIGSGLTLARRRFGRTTSAADVNEAICAACRDGIIEFGHLDENMQKSVIRKIIDSPLERSAVFPRKLMPGPVWSDDIVRKRNVIAERLSGPAYAARLERIYAHLLESEITEPVGLRADAILDQFLSPARFMLLMT